MADATSVTPRSGADRYIDTVTSVIENLSTVGEAREVSGRLAQALVDHFSAQLGEIWVLNGASDRPERQAARVPQGEVPAPDACLAARLASLTQPWTGRVADVAPDSELASWAERAGAPYLLLQPLQARDRSVGALAVYSGAQFSESEHNWARLYSGVAAVTLDDARVLLESRKAITQLQFLVEASQVLNSTLNLAELLELILKLAQREIGADRGSVFLVDRDKRQIWTILAQGLQEQEIRLNFGQGVAGHVAETGQPLIVDDAYTCELFDRSFDEKFSYRTRTILCIPIRNRQGEIAGILQLINKLEGVFTKEDAEFLDAMSVHMALALENAKLHREMLEKKRLERELQLASGIQRSLLPDAPPAVSGFDIAVLNEPCFEVGGDYYDFLRLGPSTLLVVVADVEGKGVSSAMVMSNLQATLRALSMHLHSLEVITLSLNEMILADTRSEKFLSCFLGLVDTERKVLHYINAGHIPPLLVRTNGDVLQLEAGGMVIGLFNAVEYERGSVRLEPGDILLCCTDGIMEACDKEHEEFGPERLVEVVRRHQGLAANELVQVVAREVEDYSRGGGHIDDKVLMVIKILDE